jgi:hypothetical protein
MVRIPRNEQSVGFKSVDMPFSSGDGYEAPGKAMQQLGRAISSLGPTLASIGGEFQGEADRQAEFDDNLKMAKWDNDVDLAEMQFRSSYTGTGENYAAERAQFFQDRATELMPNLSPRGQQKASLYLERKRGSFTQSAFQYETGKRDDYRFNQASETLDREAAKLAYMFPKESWNREDADGIYVPPDDKQIAAKAIEYMRGQDAIINAYPGATERAVRLKKQATDSITKFMQTLPPEVQRRVATEIEAAAASEPQPAPPGAPSNVQGGQLMRWGGGSNPQGMPTFRPGTVRDFTTKPGRGFGRLENPTHIVLHDVSGNDPERRRVPAGGNIPNYHITFDKNGINMEVPMERRAPHAVAYNANSIGIAHIGYEGEKLDEAAVRNGALAVLMVQERTGIKPENILTHPEGGSAATRRGSKDPREASWKTDVLSYIEKNRPTLVAELRSGLGGPDRVTETPRTAGAIKADLTAYSPQAKGSKMEGDYRAARPGPDGKAIVRTLDDVANGRSQYVTIAGDPSLNGKTYTIPKITYTDAAGNTHELTNVKAVVHDTGSAFKGKGEGRFDVPIARDVSNSVMAANHAAWKKAGVEFVPATLTEAQAPAQDDPAPVAQRGLTRFAGLPSMNDAGPQQPANENAPTGQRAPNTIPAAPQQPAPQGQPQQVAQVAPAGNPASGRSVLSYTAEWMREHRGALDARYAKAVAGMVEEVETLAKQGNLSPRTVMIQREVATLGAPDLQRRLNVAIQTQAEVRGLRTVPVRLSREYAAQERAALGGVMTPEQQDRLKLLDGHDTEKSTILGRNPYEWAQKSGVLPVVPELTRETFTPDNLKARMQDAIIIANRFETPLVLFQPGEKKWMEEVVKAGGQPMMQMLGAMGQGLGPMLPVAVAEISKKTPEAVQAAWLLAAGVNQDTARTIADGIARRQDPAYKPDKIKAAANQIEQIVQGSIGDAIDGYPMQMRDGIERAAELVYETRNRKPDQWDEKLFRSALNEVVGQNEREGMVYGGVFSQRPGIGQSIAGYVGTGWQGAGGTQNVILPPHIRNNSTSIERIKLAVASLTPEEMREAGLTPPVYADGRPMPIMKALGGRLVQSDFGGEIGRYTIQHGPDEAPQTVLTMRRPEGTVPAEQPAAGKAVQSLRMTDPTTGASGTTGATYDPIMGVAIQAPVEKSAAQGDYEGYIPPNERFMLDLRAGSPLTAILRRKMGHAVHEVLR